MPPRPSFHEDLAREEQIETSSDRAFGLTFAGVFALIAAFSAWRHGPLWPYATAVAAAFLIVSLARPAVLAPLNRLWTRFGLLLGKIVSPIVLGLLFFVTIVPIGWIMRARGKDLLRLKFDPDAASYWIEREPPGPPPETMRNQF